MLTPHLKSTIKKILVWFFASCLIGYLCGAIMATILFFDSTFGIIFVYLFGLALSLQYLIVGGPVFLIVTTIYFILDKKYKIDQSWLSITLLTLMIAVINTLIALIFIKFSAGRFDQIIITIIFYSTWLGTLLPRLLLKSLNPNKTA